ncbi:SWPV2-ORF251 [Shearwaterpox virus]|uniref:SWPV2-ORF251 n=1 Tax=Shearwaterpox virus TaxID=1974596 RepID=A0A1V0QGN0_CNPV|nr:SWPV2-ORF251 [Shearwaterpox virus]QRM15544.1 A type inclusion-like/fusion protein [Mudlarkpox virus]QRM15897.1 a type inclusion-like/fusion protein [Penguinpox virus 2]QRM16234.1 a type inclusion-like/fusion protein [Albatrosspox virus]
MDVVPGAGEEEELDPRQPIPTDDPVTLFVSIVKESWNTQLRQDSYINRYYACCIRNIIRYHMESFKDHRTVSEFYGKILNYETLIKGKAYSGLMSYNHGEFAELLQQIHNSTTVDTLGKYIAFMVMFFISTAKERISISQDETDKIYETIRRIRHRYYNRITSIHMRFRCKYMFIGIPCYLFPDDSAFGEILEWGANIFNKPYMMMHKNYLEYLKNNPRNPGDKRTVMLATTASTWYFNNSIPEYVLKGLCYRHDDIIATETDERVRFYLRYLPDSNKYAYHEVISKTYPVKFPSPITVKFDTFAVSIGNPDAEGNKYSDLISTTYNNPFNAIDELKPAGTVKLNSEDPVPPDYNKASDGLPVDEDPINADDDDDDDDDDEDKMDKNRPVAGDDMNRREDKARGDLGQLKQKALKRLERRLARVEQDHVEVAKSCSIVAETLDRLERHADTLRQSMVNLAKKIDYQTGYGHMYLE